MQPLFEEKIDYVQKIVGFGKASTVKLFNERLEVVDKAGNSVANIALNQITSAAYVKGGLLRIEVGEARHFLQFFRMPYRLFGILGLILSGSSKKGSELAAQLTNLGVKIETKVI